MLHTSPPHLAYYDLLLRCSESLLDTKVCTGIQQALSDIEKVAENKELIDLLIACYETFEVKEIRTVSTNKFMYRVTLKINEQKETVKVLKSETVITGAFFLPGMAVCGGVVSLRVVDGLLAVLDLAPVLGRPFLPLAPSCPSCLWCS